MFASEQMEHVRALTVRAGTEIIRPAIASAKEVRFKGRIDLVTDTDVAVEEFLKQELAGLLPGSTFLAEETSDGQPVDEEACARMLADNEYVWIIDPVDGTTNFVHAFPVVATSVALCHRGEVIFGVVNLPILNECYHAIGGAGAFLNGEAISVTSEDTLERCLIGTGFPYGVGEMLDPIMDNLRAVLGTTQGVRRPGAAAADLAFTACGRYDGFYELGLKPWDVAAGMLLVREAGGNVTRFGPVREYAFGSHSVLATNGRIHEALGELLRER